MRRRAFFLLMFCCSAISVLSQKAEATIYEELDVILVPYAESALENGGHIAVAWNKTLNNCTGNNVYIAPEDKALYATALSAQVAGIHANIRYDNNATPVTFGSYGGLSITCKLVGVSVRKTSY